MQTGNREPVLPWAAEVLAGLYNSLGAINNGQPLSLPEKMKLLVQSPAALEDALACLLGNTDVQLRVRLACFCMHACSLSLPSTAVLALTQPDVAQACTRHRACICFAQGCLNTAELLLAACSKMQVHCHQYLTQQHPLAAVR